MKGNFQLKLVIFLVLSCFWLVKPTWAQEDNCKSLSVNAIVQTNSCQGSNNGSIKLTVSGGAAPYTFNWDHKAVGEYLTDLSSGIYSVTVLDSEGCQARKSFKVEDNLGMQLSADISEASSLSAKDGEVKIHVSGGAAPFTFFISDYTNPSKVKRYQQTSEVFKNLGRGRYVVDVEDHRGCISTISLMVRNSF